MTPHSWAIYYSDGTIVTSDAISWERARAFGVIAVIQWFEETYPQWIEDHWEVRQYRNVLCDSTYDFYWIDRDSGLVSGGRSHDITHPTLVYPKAGQYLPNEEFYSIYNAALMHERHVSVTR